MLTVSSLETVLSQPLPLPATYILSLQFAISAERLSSLLTVMACLRVCTCLLNLLSNEFLRMAQFLGKA